MATAPRHRTVRRVTTVVVALTLLLVPLTGLGPAQQSGAQSFVAVQDGECIPLTSFSGEESAVEFYDYRLPSQYANNLSVNATGDAFGSEGTTDLQRANTSVVFLYTDTDDGGTNLVFVHGAEGNANATGGAATFDVTGLPEDGEWVVRDDDYDGPSNIDTWDVGDTRSVVDWSWSAASTDGGVHSGLDADSSVIVQPAFNDAAALSNTTDGTVQRWQVLSSEADGVTRTSLDLDEPLLIAAGTCGDGGDGGDGGGGDGGDDVDVDEDEIVCPPGTVPRTVEIPTGDSGNASTGAQTSVPGQGGNGNATPSGPTTVTATICVNETQSPTPPPTTTTTTTTTTTQTPTPTPTDTATPVVPPSGPDTPDDGTPDDDGGTLDDATPGDDRSPDDDEAPGDGDGVTPGDGDDTEAGPDGADGGDGADGSDGGDGGDEADGGDGADGSDGGDGGDEADGGDGADGSDGGDGGDEVDGGDEADGGDGDGSDGDEGGDDNGGNGGDGGDGGSGDGSN